ncbi:nudix hydrolase 15, mitochondrial-like [Phalaenopsis equestris]|uniref:nudix hydrolase 15, mitochondrial-like n=1 Tax=Phalaenopsis equestris TaxID=78828 RepID=UPI0009E2C4C6|nr:nudix hydrolase 15, mitochondrial-like [Phalaenopsis equestris]XP_020577322.1 nudix hydrolase 15, mitochondrial-like [Phalaenopsis equestris]XP_020577323.1 nudix hydrolase 15, mitochondrial-like [Phalaenopsis equestris]XP_020577324.1 nudix hydrolase 15, mitochondrial-like [Phalaenopsis equestris]
MLRMAARLRGLAMAASNNSISSNPMQPSSNIQKLIQQLRLYSAPRFGSSFGNEDDEIDERGKVFSQMGLAESSVPPPVTSQNQRAAVLICLFEGDHGDLRVILTKRSSNLSSHSGEVALPGGKADESDPDDVATAMREANEEIGLDPSLVNVVTVLEPFLSKNLLRVVPVIGILSDRQAFKPVANVSEVEAIFDAPLEMFLKDENRRAEERELMGADYLIHFFDYQTDDKKFLIWGLTASILIHAASIVYQRPPSFAEQYRKFHHCLKRDFSK